MSHKELIDPMINKQKPTCQVLLVLLTAKYVDYWLMVGKSILIALAQVWKDLSVLPHKLL